MSCISKTIRVILLTESSLKIKHQISSIDFEARPAGTCFISTYNAGLLIEMRIPAKHNINNKQNNKLNNILIDKMISDIKVSAY